jgi:hypothetical protein
VNGVTGDHKVEFTLGPPVIDYDHNVSLTLRENSNYWEKPYVIRIPAHSSEQVAFYLAHLFGRKKRSSVTADIDIAGVDFKQLAIELVGGQAVSYDFSSLPWTSPETQMMWIREYVLGNRLETAFAAAIDLLGSLAFHPLESYQEGTMWHEGRMTVNLSRFTPTRARVPSNLEGEGYRTTTAPVDFIFEEGSNLRQYLMISAFINYAMWYGMYALIDNASGMYSNWADVLKCRLHGLECLDSVDMRADLASLLFGKEVHTVTSPNAFITFSPEGLSRLPYTRFAKVKEAGYPAIFKHDSLHPPVSGSLLLGTTSADLRACEHLHAHQTVEFSERGTTDTVSAVKLANIYRLFGHDVTLVHPRTGEEFEMYANARDCVVSPNPVYANTRTGDYLGVDHMAGRRGRKRDIMSTDLLQFGGKLEVIFAKPTLTVTKWGSATERARGVLMLMERPRPVVFNVPGRRVIQEVRLAHLERKMPKLDFQVSDIVTAPEMPIAVVRTRPISSAADALDPVHVEGVE